MASQEGMKWYVLRAISGQENKIKNFIEAEVKHLSMDDLLGQILIPTEKVYQIRDGKKVLKERNFFPGYIMVEATLTGELVHLIKKVNNVIGFLGETKGGVPV
ncbi:MAG: transcription termination/antitermination factor NusG, partial [Schleiferiaceae bacterium]|nr:transcription termination/antitermination factor NusG [Schleiferiaceae bacterium]